MATKDEIIDSIANMSVMEVSELVKAMEEKFGVTAAAPVAVAAAPAAGVGGESAAEEAEEKSEFTIVLKGFADGKKIPVIKEVRALTGLALKDAKDLVEAGDRPVKEGIPKEEAEKAKERLEAAGATIEVQ
jgi:large subunit ribosomal protein L7/L12